MKKPASPKAGGSEQGALRCLELEHCLGFDSLIGTLCSRSRNRRRAAEERDTTKPTDNLVAGRSVIRLGNVATPTISVYRPPKDRDTGTAIVVFPGVLRPSRT